MAMPIELKILSTAAVARRLPMNTLKLPCSVLERVPTTSLSTSWIWSSTEKDWATAPYMIWLFSSSSG